MELDDLLTYVIALNQDRRVVGKTRLQKIMFLLDQCGLGSDSRYGYHYYGPFSADVAEAADDATLSGRLRFEESRGFYDIPYGTYEISDENIAIPARLGSLPKAVVQKKLDVMSGYSAIELELAATIQYLREQGFSDAINDVKQLKPAKATAARLQQAEELLHKLELREVLPS